MSIYMLVVLALSQVVSVTAQSEDANCLLQGKANVTHTKSRSSSTHTHTRSDGIPQDHGQQGHVYSFDDLPEDCKTFAKGCLAGSTHLLQYSSWNDTSAAFEACCLAGHHQGSTCKSLAEEAFGKFRERSAEFELTASVCTEMKDLYHAHTAWAEGSVAAQLLQTQDARASAVVSRMLELQREAPVFIKALLLGATVAGGIVSSGVSLAQLSMSAMLTAIATQLQQCELRKHMADGSGDAQIVVCIKKWSDTVKGPFADFLKPHGYGLMPVGVGHRVKFASCCPGDRPQQLLYLPEDMAKYYGWEVEHVKRGLASVFKTPPWIWENVCVGQKMFANCYAWYTSVGGAKRCVKIS